MHCMCTCICNFSLSLFLAHSLDCVTIITIGEKYIDILTVTLIKKIVQSTKQ